MASFVSFLLVFNSLLFPYISSKQIYFNILVELLTVVWLAFILKYPQWRPKWSWVNKGLLAYFAVILASCFVSVDLNLSFWGDVERMLGFFHLTHFLLFYFILITVMREWKDWRILFIVSLATAIIISLKAVFGSSESTIGNKAYVAGLLIFNIYFALLLFFRDMKISAARPGPWLYLIPLPLFLWAFAEQNITGAKAGLGISVILFVFLLGVLDKRRKVRLGVLGLALAAATLIAGVSFHYSDRIEGYFAEQETFQTRLIAWEGALRELPDHLLLGTGYGTFAITFDKTFDADFYNHVKDGATYFDRAHNNLIDIVSTTGILGAAAYLSIFVALAYYLIAAFRRERIGRTEFSLLIALVAGYFVQNLSVFDSLVTYISLMCLLGFVHWLSFHPDKGAERELRSETGDKKLIDKEIFTWAGVGLAALVVIHQFNIQPLNMLTGTIEAQQILARGDVIRAKELQEKAMSYGTPLDRDSREIFARSVTGAPQLLKPLSGEQREEVLEYCIRLLKENLECNPRGAKMQLQLARAYTSAYRFAGSEEERREYAGKALEAVDGAIESSPERIPLYLVKAQTLSNAERAEEAVETLEHAASLNENYYEVHCYLARMSLMRDMEEKAYPALEKCIATGGAKLLDSEYVIKKGINHYLQKEDVGRLTRLYERLAEVREDDGEVWMKLAQLYASQEQKEDAEQAARRAARADDDLSSQVETFIGRLEKGGDFQFLSPDKMKEERTP